MIWEFYMFIKIYLCIYCFIWFYWILNFWVILYRIIMLLFLCIEYLFCSVLDDFKVNLGVVEVLVVYLIDLDKVMWIIFLLIYIY